MVLPPGNLSNRPTFLHPSHWPGPSTLTWTSTVALPGLPAPSPPMSSPLVIEHFTTVSAPGRVDLSHFPPHPRLLSRRLCPRVSTPEGNQGVSGTNIRGNDAGSLKNSQSLSLRHITCQGQLHDNQTSFKGDRDDGPGVGREGFLEAMAEARLLKKLRD